jgi:branched-chain amino acid transport system ATP-binding protein
LLKVESIETYYGKIKVLMGVSMELTSGQLVAVIGANGAGKSTMLRTIMGISQAEYGKIEFLGQRIEEKDPDEITRLGISMVPEGRWIFTDLTVKENLDMGSIIRSDKKGIKEDLDQVYSIFPVLQNRPKQKAGLLSGGEQQMLAIGRGLMSRPKLLMLDEPSLGLSPILIKEIFRIIKEIFDQGTPILLIEQNMTISMTIATYAYVMETGRMRLSGTTEKILADEDVREFYLGEGKGKYVSRKDRWKGKMS